MAAAFGHLHIVKYLTDEQGCNPSCLDEHMQYTPLHWAAMKGHLDIVKFLTVEKQCDPICRDCDEDTPLHKAAAFGHIEVVKFLTLEMHCVLNKSKFSQCHCFTSSSGEWAFGHSSVLPL